MKGMMDSLQSCRWLALLLIAVMLMQLVGCGGGGNSTNLSLVSEQPDTVDFFVQPSGSEAPILTTVSGSLMDIEALEKLVIDSAKPDNETIKDSTSVVKVVLEAGTSAGYKEGRANCYFSETGKDDDYTLFLETDS